MDTTSIELWRADQMHDSLRISDDFGAIVRSAQLPTLLHHVIDVGGVVVAATADDELRGYATLVPSAALTGERWEHSPDTYELGGLEVARSAREKGIGTALLARLDASLPVERLLVFARGFIGHWDTTTAGLTPGRYRLMLLRMLTRSGFQRWDTDDPEVTDHPMNFLAVRVGLQAAASSIAALMGRASTSSTDPWW